MDMLALAMIYLGSGLMVYNIVRYVQFMREMLDSDGWKNARHVLIVPLALLVFFLVGYLAVGMLGQPDLIVGSILFGGSVFVNIILWVIFQIVSKLRDNNSRSLMLYDSMHKGMDSLAKEFAAVFVVDLTRDHIDERMGSGLYASDHVAVTYTDLMASRYERLLSPPKMRDGYGLFTREGLLRSHQKGDAAVQETLLCQLEDGRKSFVKLEARLAVQPGTQDVIAFITESLSNDELVNETILNKALIEQFDMICYLMDGFYRVVIGDAARIGKGSIFPHELEGYYDDYLRERVCPVLQGTPEEQQAALQALSMAHVDAALTTQEPYEVNISCDIDGEVFHKRFVYYVIDREAKFYLLLKSDTTDVRREEMKRAEVLSEALAEARRASEMKSTFLSNMSHDIRTPMNAIVGYTEFARRSESLEQKQEYLEKIDASSKYMLALINDVLEMSRIESGKMDLEPEPCDLLQMMGELRDMFQTQMDAKHVSFMVDTTQVRDSHVSCDKVRLNRVLLNLLSNAYKFTPEGGAVTVSLAQQTDMTPGFGSYELRVSDTGVGMSEEFAAHVFEAFERERTTTVSGIQGTGLGMAITKRIVDMMGGSIIVHTKEGKGTTFVVTLSLELDSGWEQSAPPASDGEEEVPDLEGLKVLLAEDNEINREIATVLLEDLGFEVEAVVDGRQAVDRLVERGAGAYDVVITDIQMPVLNGLDEAREIRALDDPAIAGIPIVAMSANAFQEDVRAAYDAGIDGYTSKPIDVGELLDELARVLRERGQIA